MSRSFNTPTLLVLRALAEKTCTGPELDDVLGETNTMACQIVSTQRAAGNITRIDGRPGKGYVATYALTEAGKRKIGL